MDDLRLFSAKVSKTGKTSAVKYIRLPVDFILQVHAKAERESRTFNRVLAEAAMRGFERIEQEKEVKQNVT